MATLTIEFDHADVRRAIAEGLERYLPGIKVRPENVIVEVKAEGSDKWEIAHTRYRYVDSKLL